MGRSSASGLAVAVFGATGHLGRHVVQRLLQRGAEVVLPVRGELQDAGALRVMGDLGRVHLVPYELRDEKAIADVVRSVDVVVNALAQDRRTFCHTIGDVNVRGAAAIARAAEAAPRRPTLVHVGCMRAAPDAPSEYSRTKWAGEQAVLAANPRATIVRPATLFGPQDRLMNGFGQFVGRPLGVPVLRGGRQVLRPVHVADVADALALVVEARGLYPHDAQRYDLPGPRAYTRRRLAELLVAAAAAQARVVSMGPRALWLYARVVPEILRVPFPYDVVLQMLESDSAPGSAGAAAGHPGGVVKRTDGEPVGFADLGFTQLRTLEDSLLSIARPYRLSAYFHEPLVLPPHLLEDSV